MNPTNPRRGTFTKVVIDTGPLFTILTLNYVRQTHPTEEKRLSILERADIKHDVLRSPSRQHDCLLLFESIPTVLTTSHVIGEIQGRQKKIKAHDRELHGADLRSFWLHTMDLLRRKNLDERLLCLLEMHARDDSREAVCSIGPTDTGLIELARLEGCSILTDDERTLAKRAWELGIDCQLMKNLID